MGVFFREINLFIVCFNIMFLKRLIYTCIYVYIYMRSYVGTGSLSHGAIGTLSALLPFLPFLGKSVGHRWSLPTKDQRCRVFIFSLFLV